MAGSRQNPRPVGSQPSAQKENWRMRKYDLTINDNSYEVVVKETTDTHVRAEVNGVEHTVSIDKIESLVLPKTISVAKAREQSDQGTASLISSARVTSSGVIAPMPGQIKAILVREGDRVIVGQKLLIMEAMKLENKIPADKNGIVQKILVRDGDVVSQGQQLVVIV